MAFMFSGKTRQRYKKNKCYYTIHYHSTKVAISEKLETNNICYLKRKYKKSTELYQNQKLAYQL